MDAAPRGRTGLWRALAAATTGSSGAAPALPPPPDADWVELIGPEAPHLGYLGRVRGGAAGPAADHPSITGPSRRHAGEGGDLAPVIDLAERRAHRARRLA